MDATKVTAEIEVDTGNLDEATEKVQNLADAINEFPAQVIIRGARDCTFNIYPSQTRIFAQDD